MIPLAIVGPGKIAGDAHLPALAGHAGFRLVACVGPQPALAAGLRALPLLPDLATLRATMPEVTAVAICTPPQVRAGLAQAAIAAGLHVLVEKPPAATLSDCAALEQAAEAAGVTLFAAWHSRFAPMVATARGWLAGRRVTGGRIDWMEDVRVWHPGQHWLWRPGGLGVFDSGINALSILTAIAPAPVSVAQPRFAVPANAATPLRVDMDLRVGEAIVATRLDFLHEGPPLWRIELDCGAERMVLDQGGSVLHLPGLAPQTAPEAEYAGVYDHFATLVAAGARELDTAPLRLVADAFLTAEVSATEPFTP